MRRPVPRRRAAGAAAVVTVLMTGALAAPPAQARSSVATGHGTSAGKPSRAELFHEAGERHRVPETVLLAVSYLQSRWDDHHGAPSVDAGFGPMHLTDARAALAETHHHSSGHEDPRGDASRPPLVRRETPVDQERLPASLET
ncbi:N-acetylmuramoyl-L-alanine amidase, partial [Streptomyces sp. WAC02707]